MLLLRAILKAFTVPGAFATLFCLASTGALAYPHLTAESASPIYMNCPDFTKGAQSARGLNWIELQSFSFGSSNASTIGSATGGAGAGKATPHEFHITTTLDKASPSFFRTSTGKHDNCTVNFDKPNTSPTQPYMTLEFQNVIVSSYHVSSGRDRPVESISLNFFKVEYKNKVTSGEAGKNTLGTGAKDSLGPPEPSSSTKPR